MSSDPDDLLAAVLADPGDDDLRRVYADRLLELGDPRGELIMLQYQRRAGAQSDDARSREQALLAKHAVDWLGPLHLVVREGFKIERGFLSSCVVPEHRRPYNVERVVGHRLWATVEHFEGPPVLFLHPVMRALRSLTPVRSGSESPFVELCTGPVERAIERLDVDWVGSEADAAPFATAPALPRLRELVARGRDLDTLRMLVTAPLAARLECLMYKRGDGIQPPLAAWLRTLNEVARIPVVVLDGSRWYSTERYELHRRDSRYDELRLTLDRDCDAYMLQQILAHLSGSLELLHRVEVVFEAGSSVGAIAFDELRAVVDQFAEHSLVFE